MSPQIEQVPYSVVERFRGRAAKEGVSLADTLRTDWFVIRLDGKVIALGGLLRTGSTVRIKGAWVEPSFRGQGLGLALTRHRIEVAERMCASQLHVLTYSPVFFAGLGFKALREMPNGAVSMRRVL